MENVIELLERNEFKRFWSDDPRFEKVLTEKELALYFEEDADTTDDIESGDVAAAHIIIDVEDENATFALFDHVPSEQDISNATVYHEDWYAGAIEAIEKL